MHIDGFADDHHDTANVKSPSCVSTDPLTTSRHFEDEVALRDMRIDRDYSPHDPVAARRERRNGRRYDGRIGSIDVRVAGIHLLARLVDDTSLGECGFQSLREP